MSVQPLLWRAVAALAVAALTATACAGEEARPRRASSPAPVPSARSLLPASPTELPTFDLAMFERLLADLRGTPVVVNIWASWCGPCREEAPHLAEVARDYRDRVQFLGVDILDHRGNAQAFIREYGWPYPSVFDPTGSIRDGLGYLGQPITIVYDRRGEESFVWSGAITKEQLAEEVERVAS